VLDVDGWVQGNGSRAVLPSCTSAAFTTKAAACPAGKRRWALQATLDTPKIVQKPSINETEMKTKRNGRRLYESFKKMIRKVVKAFGFCRFSWENLAHDRRPAT